MRSLPIHVKILLGLLLGIIWAILSSFMGWSQFNIDWIKPFGTIFINLLKLIAVPLVLFSIIEGVSSLTEVSKLGRMGLKTLSLYIVTTVIAVSVGLILVNLYKPGERVSEDQRIDNRISYELWVSSTNGVEIIDDRCLICDLANTDRVATIRRTENEKGIHQSVQDKLQHVAATKEQGPLQSLVDMIPSNIFVSLNDNGLMLQVIVFAIFFGVTLLMIPREKVIRVIDFVHGTNLVFLKMVEIVMKGAPFFVFALLAGVISEMAGDDPIKVLEIFKALAQYSVILVVGLAFMVFGFYPVIIHIVVKGMNYMSLLKSMGAAQLLGFTTSSSVATLPMTMKCVKKNLGVPEETANFVLPIGATVNMDGTSLYQAVAVVFLAQFHMVDLTFTQQLMIVLTATLASIGSAAVPSAGLVMMILVLQSVGLNPAWIAIIFPVDRPLDMCRTVVNVTGDATVGTLVASSEGQLENSVT